MKITALPIRSFMRRRALPKLLISFLLISIAYLLLSSSVNAQSPTLEDSQYNSYSISNSYNINPGIEANSHNAIQVIFIDFLSAISCQLSGYDPINPEGKCLGVDRETGKIGFVENGGGALLIMGKLIDSTLAPPTSGMQYVAYLKNNFGIAKNTYAQTPGPSSCQDDVNGVGFCTISPLLTVWQTMRNIVYLIFILVFVVIGIGIMLRLHIDPRTVMTIQNQIPKIIVGIIAITFSFAIAGFLIDIMWVAVYLFAGVIIQSAQAANISGFDTIGITQATNPFQAANAAAKPIGGDLPVFDIATTVGTAFSDMISNFLKSAFDWGIINDIINIVINALAVIIIFVAILFALLKLWISLLFAFINIILDIIFAPWWILAGLVPGSTISLGSWIRDLIANLAVFPVTIGFLLLGLFLMAAFQGSTNDALIAFPLLGGQSGQSISVLIGFGFILMLPSILTSVKAALKTPKMNFGNLMSPVGAGAGFLAGGAKRSYGLGTGYMKARTVQELPKVEADGTITANEGRLSRGQTVKRMFLGKVPKTNK